MPTSLFGQEMCGRLFAALLASLWSTFGNYRKEGEKRTQNTGYPMDRFNCTYCHLTECFGRSTDGAYSHTSAEHIFVPAQISCSPLRKLRPLEISPFLAQPLVTFVSCCCCCWPGIQGNLLLAAFACISMWWLCARGFIPTNRMFSFLSSFVVAGPHTHSLVE